MLIRYVVTRIASAALTLFGVSVLVFLAIHLIPGRFEDVVLGPFASPQERAAAAVRLGLNRPLTEQYVRWLLSAFHGDFGNSLVYGTPIISEFARRAPITAQLALMSAVTSLLVGLPLGIVAGLGDSGGYRRGLSRAVGAVAMSVPDFVLGSVFVFVFSAFPLWLTVGGFVPLLQDPIANLRAMLLPALTLSVFGTSLILRTSRDAIRSVLSEPYITAAVARGERPGEIVRRHVLRNASIPIITVAATNVGYLLGGAVIVELLFSIPGLGHYLLDAITVRDYPVVQIGVTLAAAIFIVLNMLTDIAYVLIDPRIGSRRGT